MTSETPVLIFSLIFRTRYNQYNTSKAVEIPTDTYSYLKTGKKNVSLMPWDNQLRLNTSFYPVAS